MKRLLDAEGIEYDDNASLAYLRSRAQVRIRRNEGPAARAALFAFVDAEAATGTLSRVKEKMDALASEYDSVLNVGTIPDRRDS